MMNARTRTHCKPVTPPGGPARQAQNDADVCQDFGMAEACALTVTIEISPRCSSCRKVDCGLFGQVIVCLMLNPVTYLMRNILIIWLFFVMLFSLAAVLHVCYMPLPQCHSRFDLCQCPATQQTTAVDSNTERQRSAKRRLFLLR